MPTDTRSRLRQLIDSGEAALHPPTFPQRELWETTSLPLDSPSNHICAFLEVLGTLTADTSATTLQRVVDRQDVLRLALLPGKGQRLQLIRARESVVPNFRDVGNEALADLMAPTFERPFDLLRGPLYRFDILRRGANEIFLVFAIHHAIADGWSLGVFVEDLVNSYILGLASGNRRLPPVPVSYPAWDAEQRAIWKRESFAEKIAFWRTRLAGAPRLWSTPRPPIETPLQRRALVIEDELTTATRELARRNGATLFHTLLTAFQIALHLRTGARDITVGSPIANRSQPSIRETMGYFSTVVPLRGQVDPARSVADTLRTVHSETVDAFANAIPFAELVAALAPERRENENPIFEVRFALQNHPIPDTTAPGFAVRMRMRSTGTARFDLACEITETGSALEVVWLSRPTFLSAAELSEYHRVFRSVLTQACRNDSVFIRSLAN